MAHSLLPDDVTLADVVPTLTKPRDYVREAFLNMFKAGGERRSELVLRIGLTGAGKAPHYRVDRRQSGFSLSAPPSNLMGSQIELESLYRYEWVADFHGRNHKPLIPGEEGYSILRPEHWSKGDMTFKETRILLHEVMNAKWKAS